MCKMRKFPFLFTLFYCTFSVASAVTMLEVVQASAGSLFSDQEEAPYTVLQKHPHFEERLYPPRNWVCKDIEGKKYDELENDVFLDLFGYLYGENEKEASMAMAIPVSVAGSTNSTAFEICFFIGSKYQTNPPQPTNANLKIKKRPEMTVFTRKFGGYATSQEAWNKETKNLLRSLDGSKVVTGAYYWNAFDSPLKFWSRRNEVWIPKLP